MASRISHNLDAYFAIQAEIHGHFGYQEQYRIFPLDDQRDKHWMLVGGEEDGAKVVYSPTPFTAAGVRKGDTLYSGTIYTQRHLDRWVYRADDHVMALVDTGCDLNILLMIFDSGRECKDDRLRETYEECW